jgi:DDE superfamily endonuclease
MIFKKFDKVTDDRACKALIGLTRAHFNPLLKAFEKAHFDFQQERYRTGEIKRIPVGGSKGHLDTPAKKLFFILYYLKNYCTFDVLGFHFGFSAGHAHQHVEQLFPVLQRTLADLNILPKRTLATVDDLKQLVEQYREIAIDGVECACVRPGEDILQKARYSGKKNVIPSKP